MDAEHTTILKQQQSLKVAVQEVNVLVKEITKYHSKLRILPLKLEINYAL